MGILFTILMGILFTITIGILFTIVLGIQFTISNFSLFTLKLRFKEFAATGSVCLESVVARYFFLAIA